MPEWLQYIIGTLFIWLIGFATSYKQISIKRKRGVVFWCLFLVIALIVAVIAINLPNTLLSYVLALIIGYALIRMFTEVEKHFKPNED